MTRGQDQQSRAFQELCGLVYNILRTPPLSVPLSTAATTSSSSSSTMMTTTSSDSSSSSSSSSRRTPPSSSIITQVSPAGFASLLLGVSLALMLCGSVTFVIGFILMPWVLGLVMVLYLAGIVSNLSGLGRAILCPTSTPPPPPVAPSRKEMSGEGFRYSMLGIFPVIPF